jgi:hypothetical protein
VERNVERRLRRIEDQLSIYQIISAYNVAVDSSDLDLLCDLWHEDGELVVQPPATLEAPDARPEYGVSQGHQGLRDRMMGDRHKMLVAQGSAHVNSLPHVVIDGDLATATSYQKMFLFKNGQFVVDRLSAARWEFIRTANGWNITKRISEAMRAPNKGALELLRRLRDVR